MLALGTSSCRQVGGTEWQCPRDGVKLGQGLRRIPVCLLSTHYALFPFPGEISPAVHVSRICLATSQCSHHSMMGWKGDIIQIN